jgi:PAS domain S-box-containing protein
MLRVIESQLMLLVGASGALLASPKSAHVLETILRLAQQFVDAEAYAVWRRRGDEWQLVLSTGLSDNYEQANRVAAAKWSGSLTAAPLVIEDVENSEIVRHRLSLYRAERIRSILAVPLQIHGESAGTIVFYYRSPHTFSDAERRVAGALGNLAAAALGTAELYEREAELRRVAEAAERRSSFLATVGETLASSLEYEATLASVAKLAVPFFADWCGVDIVDDYGTVRRLAVQHVDPAKIEFAYEFMRRYPPREDDPTRVALRTGQSILMPEIPEALLIESATNAQHLELMRTIGLKSVICAPMQARGRVLGVITFVTSDSGRRYGSSDLALAEEIASRAAVAVENARLFKEVRESEERFRRLYDSNMVGIAFWHSDSYLTAANDAYLHQMGITREEFEVSDNVSWVPFTPDEYRAVDDQIIRECREHGASGIYEKEYAHRDGTRVTVLIAAAFLSSSQHQGVAFALDITDRKKLERQFRGVADAAVSINGARSVEDVLRVVAEQARVLIGARESSASLSAENSSVEAGTLSGPLKNRSGQNIGAVRLSNGPSADFSESDRAIVIQLAEMASIAIQNVTLNEFLLRSNEELRRANEDLNQFAYSASHDLQEPLRMIAIYTQLLSRKCGAQFDSEAHTFMRYTLEGAQRMEMLLRDLLAYTHAINIRGFPQGPVDSAKALQEALANLQTAIAAAGAEIRIGTMPSVRAFEAHLVQLFQNLLGNAIKYRSSAPPVIEVNATQDSDRGMWLFSVRDNGIGINPKYHQQVFGLFKRLYPSNEYPGTGIGLAICQRVVERYGGAIWVESEQGRGSTFHFTLPA